MPKPIKFKDNAQLDKAVVSYWRKASRVQFDTADKQDIYNLLDQAECLVRGLSEALAERNGEAASNANI